MKGIKFKQAINVLKGGPAKKYGTLEDVYDLPIWTDFEKQIVSCWRPSLRERLSILFFGKVWFHCRALTHPPISITGIKNYFVEENKDAKN